MSNPFTKLTLENFEGCEFRCEKSWLPVDGEVDAILVTREMAIDAGDRELEGQVYQELLIPTTFTACPCNPLYSMNSEMEVVEA